MDKNNSCSACQDAGTCFHHLFPDDSEYFNNKKQQLSYSKGENICKQGAFAPYVMYVYKGLVKTYLEVGGGKSLNLRIVRCGEFISFQSVLNQQVYNYSALALTDAHICLIDKESLKKMLKENIEASWHVISENCRNESNMYEIVKNITAKQMPGKLATALLYLSDDLFAQDALFSHLSRRDIAEFAGISLESTVKLLKEFESEKLISLERKSIEIINEKGLKEISMHG